MGLHIIAFTALIFLLWVSTRCAVTTWAKGLLWLGRQLAGLKSGHVSVNTLRWHYLHGGTGPTLVLVHGFGADADHWLKIAPKLSRHFRIIAPDLIGFGSSSEGNDLSFDISSQAGRLSAFLNALSIERCIIAGSSMGGWIASVLAARYPEKISALWLLAPLGVNDCRKGPLLEAIDTDNHSPLKAENFVEFEQRVLRPMFFGSPKLPRPLRMYYWHRAEQRNARAHTIFSEARGERPHLETTIEDIEVPILLHWGRQDQAVDVSGANTLCKRSAKITAHLLSNTGHLPMLEKPNEVSAQFLDFCRDRNLTDNPAIAPQ